MKNKFNKLINYFKNILYAETPHSPQAKNDFLEYTQTNCFVNNPEFMNIYNRIVCVKYNGIIKDSHNYSNGKGGVVVLDDESELAFRTMDVKQNNGKTAKYLLFTHEGIKIGLANLWERWIKNEKLFVCEECPLKKSSIDKLVTVATTINPTTKQMNFYTDQHMWFGKAWQHSYKDVVESLLAYKDFINTENCIIQKFECNTLPENNPLVLSQEVPTKTKIVKIADLAHPEDFCSNSQPLLDELSK